MRIKTTVALLSLVAGLVLALFDVGSTINWMTIVSLSLFAIAAGFGIAVALEINREHRYLKENRYELWKDQT